MEVSEEFAVGGVSFSLGQAKPVGFGDVKGGVAFACVDGAEIRFGGFEGVGGFGFVGGDADTVPVCVANFDGFEEGDGFVRREVACKPLRIESGADISSDGGRCLRWPSEPRALARSAIDS